MSETIALNKCLRKLSYPCTVVLVIKYIVLGWGDAFLYTAPVLPWPAGLKVAG